MLKCPHCNGLLSLEAIRHPPLDTPLDSVMGRLGQWVRTPVRLSDLLLSSGYTGDLTRFEPLGRMVVRTAFCSLDAARDLGIDLPSEKLHYVIKGLPGWSARTTRAWLLGMQGRWWIKTGYEWAPGFVEPEDDLV